MMDPGTLLTAAGMLAAGAAAWGTLRQRVVGNERAAEQERAANAEAIRELRASSVRQGERMGELERRVAIDRAVRRATGAVPSTGRDETE